MLDAHGNMREGLPTKPKFVIKKLQKESLQGDLVDITDDAHLGSVLESNVNVSLTGVRTRNLSRLALEGPLHSKSHENHKPVTLPSQASLSITRLFSIPAIFPARATGPSPQHQPPFFSFPLVDDGASRRPCSPCPAGDGGNLSIPAPSRHVKSQGTWREGAGILIPAPPWSMALHNPLTPPPEHHHLGPPP